MTVPLRPVVAVVPTRSPGAGKTRLAPGLDVGQRAALGSAMLRDVVTALTASPVDRIVVAAAGESAAREAAALGVEVLADPPGGDGLDAAVAAALSRLPEQAAIVVVMADLPCLTPADVSQLLAHGDAVVIAATDDGGTGALLRRPAGVMPTAYGPDSARRHRLLARDAGVTARTVRLPGFRHDVDTSTDLARLRRLTVGPATQRFLSRLGAAPPGGEAAAG